MVLLNPGKEMKMSTDKHVIEFTWNHIPKPIETYPLGTANPDAKTFKKKCSLDSLTHSPLGTYLLSKTF